MIHSIQLQNLPTYQGINHCFGPLGTFNFVFGGNGAGKSTLARVIADPATHLTCSITWKSHPMTVYVYDRVFVNANFRQEMPGVFSLGAEDIGIKEKIDAAQKDRDATQDKIRKYKEQLDGDGSQQGERSRLESLHTVFQGTCYKQKQTHYERFKLAMSGHVQTQPKFAEKVLKEAESSAALLSLDELDVKYARLFNSDPVAIEEIPVLEYSQLKAAESNQILAKAVVGKADVAIAAVIKSLENSDWVEQGRVFFKKDESNCPFCQQPAPHDLKHHLEEYFDRTFSEDNAAIKSLDSLYRVSSSRLIALIGTISSLVCEYINKDAVEKEKQLIEAALKANQIQLETKLREPSRVVELQSLEESCKSLAGMIEEANGNIKNHNMIVRNLPKEREQLKSEVWRYIVEQVKDEIPKYISTKKQFGRKIKEVEQRIDEEKVLLKQHEDKLYELEKSTTSIRPTIKEINDILSSFGFAGFQLAEGKVADTYEIVRPDGQAASHSLSEGEKTFITFLYFFHLLRGSHKDSGTMEDRIVVFDDPVSSLDSNVLFIVSSLIRRLMKQVHEGCEVKQVIVLTHNVFFHKEVTLRRNKETVGNRRFWVIRKVGSLSRIEPHENKNPVKSSYERLWSDLKYCDGSPESLRSLQNTMRRILENYFTILGGVDINDLEQKFEGSDKLLCRTLIAWAQDGSHTIHDDIFMSDIDTNTEMFMNIFKRIFANLNHLAHYEMMMEGHLEAIPKTDD